MVKVIASSLRKGQVVDQDGKLYVVLTAENIHPGKGASVTQVDMRRISDGVKVSERWRTTEMVEKADVDEREYQFLYNDAEGYHFMEPTTYEQIAVPEDIIGENGHFQSAVPLICPDDEAAQEEAKQLIDGHDIELWQYARKVASFKRKS